MSTTTPAAVTPAVEDFCKGISSAQPVYLTVQTDPGAKHLDCYYNVADKIRRDGGSLVYGWIIWEETGLFLEAEHHAVWQSPAGDLVEISPHEEPHLLFLPDPGKVWNNEPFLSPRKALKADRRVEEYLALAATIDRLRIRYVRPDGTSEIPLNEANPIHTRMLRLLHQLGVKLDLPPDVAKSVSSKLGRSPEQLSKESQERKDRRKEKKRERKRKRK